MPKPLIDLAVPAGIKNFTQRAMGPGQVRVAHNEATGVADAYIFGDIGGYMDGIGAEEFARDMAVIAGDVETVNVWLNSPGGSVFEGVAIYNTLARLSAQVNIHIEGLAASIASVIAMSGDRIYISEASSVMVHKPWTIIAGDEDDLVKEAGVLRELQAALVDIYTARTGGKREEIESWVNAETWFRGQAAVAAGFADEMVPAKKKEKKAALTHARSAMLPLFKNAPSEILLPEDTPDIRIFENLVREGLGLSHTQAKQVAAMARVLNTGLRDDARPQAAAAAPATEPVAPPTAAPAEPPRDEAGPEMAKLKAHILSLIQ